MKQTKYGRSDEIFAGKERS